MADSTVLPPRAKFTKDLDKAFVITCRLTTIINITIVSTSTDINANITTIMTSTSLIIACQNAITRSLLTDSLNHFKLMFTNVHDEEEKTEENLEEKTVTDNR